MSPHPQRAQDVAEVGARSVLATGKQTGRVVGLSVSAGAGVPVRSATPMHDRKGLRDDRFVVRAEELGADAIFGYDHFHKPFVTIVDGTPQLED